MLLLAGKFQSTNAFWENPLMLSAISSFIFAQLVKAIIALTSERRSRIKAALVALFWRTGGMPSSHAALVSALTTATAISEGISSNLFVVTFFLAVIVMRDAMGVRRSSGIQAKTLNVLGQRLSENSGSKYQPVKEVQGHTPLEVIVGSLLGIIIAAAYAYL
ncbi:MAG: divergent PAP2 family protein [Spirochaetaceae bacterium]|jgi:acid phosphatase family membrane protein YuiD|nr:divergent PAP2 family protein [Spirochaetaceae bacterium]